jgi:hypothetical protein
MLNVAFLIKATSIFLLSMDLMLILLYINLIVLELTF